MRVTHRRAPAWRGRAAGRLPVSGWLGEGPAVIVVEAHRSRVRAFAGNLLPQTHELRPTRWGYPVAFLAAVAWQLLTPNGLSRLNHLWAEDGARFLVDAETRPFWVNVVEPYQGYLHTLPRLSAELVTLFPLEWAAAGFAISAAALRAVVALITYAASAAYLRSTPLRFALAALVIVLPAGNSETLANMANLHWFLVYGVFWALLWRTGPRVPLAIFVVLATLTSPLVFVLAPVALLRLALPHRHTAIAFLVSTAAQGVAVLLAERTPYSHDPADPVQVLLAALMRVPVTAFIGSEQVARVYPAFGNLPILAGLLIALVPIVIGFRQRTLLVITGVGYSVLIILIVLVSNWSGALQVQQPAVVLAGQRYSVLPCLFLFTAIVAGLDVENRLRRVTTAVIALAIAGSVLLHVRAAAVPLRGIPWDDSVVRAKAQCAAGGQVGRIEHEPDKWFFELPCTHLRT